MIRIGEKLNSSIASTRELMAKRDEGGLAALAQRQLDAGADLLDINAALFLDDEPEVLAWAVRAVQSHAGARVMIDSTNPAAVAPLLLKYGASVVALCMEEGVPPTAEGRAEAAALALNGLAARGIPRARVWLDPLVQALVADHRSAAVTLEAIRLIRERWPEITILCGVSNVSYGLPHRSAMNAAFLTAAVAAGLNAAILDAADPAMRQAAAAAEAVAGHDEYCMDYIRFSREDI